MITIRVIYISSNNGLKPMIMLKNPIPNEDDYPYLISEISDLVYNICFMGDFTQKNLLTEFKTPDQDIHISKAEQ